VVVLGITGGIGSGKGLATDFFGQRGAVIVDADEISHQLTGPGSPLLPVLAEEFGPEILRPDGRLDRKVLAERAFISPEATRRMNAIMHPAILAEVDRQLDLARQQPGVTVICLVAPLLLEAGLRKGTGVDRVLVLVADETERIRRVRERDNATEAEVKQRMAAQLPAAKQIREADWVVDTTAGREQARAQFARIWEELDAP
jgi:dephospho-CoA kinase